MSLLVPQESIPRAMDQCVYGPIREQLGGQRARVGKPENPKGAPGLTSGSRLANLIAGVIREARSILERTGPREVLRIVNGGLEVRAVKSPTNRYHSLVGLLMASTGYGLASARCDVRDAGEVSVDNLGMNPKRLIPGEVA